DSPPACRPDPIGVLLRGGDRQCADAGPTGRTTQPSVSTPGRASATTQPPNPAPVRRAPYTPGTAHNRATNRSSVVVDTSKSARKEQWLATMSRPTSPTSPAASASTTPPTRSFSVTT